jgi:hypothetical protein
MARPRKTNPDDMDAYNVDALELQLGESDPLELPGDDEREDTVPELGEPGGEGGFGGLSDEESYRYHE